MEVIKFLTAICDPTLIEKALKIDMCDWSSEIVDLNTLREA
jgi:hypothetical protein